MMPNHINYQPAVEKAIIEASQASEGRLVFYQLCHLRQTATVRSARSPGDHGLAAWHHQPPATCANIVRERRALWHPQLWEGVDLPGDELRCLVIVMPFVSPTIHWWYSAD